MFEVVPTPRSPSEPRRSPEALRVGDRAFFRTLRILLLTAVFAVTVRSGMVLAQSEEVPARYQELVAQAIEESSQGRWAEAHALFRAAHAAYPNARSFRGLAMTAFELGDYVGAVRSMRAALQSEVRPLTAEQRTEGEALLRRAEVFVGQFSTSDYPDTAVFLVDGARVELSSGRVLVLRLGQHAVEATWGETRAHTTLNVAGGELEPLVLQVDRPTHVEPVQLAVPPPTIASAPPSNHRGARLAGWTMFGAGTAGLVAGSVLLGLGRADASRVENAAVGTSWRTVQLDFEQARVRSGVGYGTLALGVTSAAIGLALALSNSEDDDHEGGASRTRPIVRAVLLPTAARLEVSF